MRIPDWEFNRDRSYPYGYPLTDTDREYLKTKRLSDHPNHPEERISEKVENLPERIQDLFVDVMLLYADERITEETWRSLLMLNRSQGRIDKESGPYLTANERVRPSISIGYQFGLILDLLYFPVETDDLVEFSDRELSQSDIAKELRWQDILWGITLAFIGENRDHIESEPESFAELIEHFENRIEQRQESVPSENLSSAYHQDQHEQREQVIRKAKEYDLEPTFGIEYVLKKGIKFYPDQSPGEFDKVLEDILSSTPLATINELEVMVIDDINRIETEEIQSVNAKEVFQILVENVSELHTYRTDETFSKEELHEQLPDANKKNSTMALRHLANEYEHIPWPESKIIEESEAGWKLTDYGVLLSHCMFKHDSRTDWMYDPYVYIDDGRYELKRVTVPALNEVFEGNYNSEWASSYGGV